MPGSEFNIIQRFFTEPARLLSDRQGHSDIVLGIGDDCAIISPPVIGPPVAPPDNQQLVVSIDTLISGVHFPEQTSPQAIAHKALAVNLSDLAAMGAEPCWFTLALTLPEADESWLASFSSALFKLAEEYNIALIGGDTTRGKLAITIQVAGYVPQGKALLRSGAQVGDIIAVSGELGAASIGLDIVLEKNQKTYHCLSEKQQQAALFALNYPSPKIKEGLLLRNYAHAALDLSDGLLSDLGHILKASAVGADVFLEQLPLAESLQCLAPEQAWERALSGGDDYQLCFTLDSDKWQQLKNIEPHFTAIGVITDTHKLRLLNRSGELFLPRNGGYNHFE